MAIHKAKVSQFYRKLKELGAGCNYLRLGVGNSVNMSSRLSCGTLHWTVLVTPNSLAHIVAAEKDADPW